MSDAQVQTELARQFIEAIPFARAVGMTIESVGGGHAVITMPFDARLVGDPRRGVLHGGVISALMDTCGGAAVMSHPVGPSAAATLDLRIDYMRAAKAGAPIRAEAECYHVTRSVAFIRATATDGEDGPPVAAATGAFTMTVGPSAASGEGAA
ncbi:PaaI family thioesterase [Roseicyclus sp. F158]|uniref:PaaI family thioesterase n=1 Tax=Tropicimonas omnivorans TaxID=3075590 RepID=A0ABU3DFS9_9RHOB|nr:PaaI family thioesterase [Roseicyclus sp. F158]MDT0682545.1 PaaI family thioesterase [Roseicyclus sp. F158]